MRYQRAVEKLIFAAALFSVLVTVIMFGFMVILGLPLIEEGHFFGIFAQPWRPDEGVYGIYPMIVGTLSISFLALLFAVPLSLGCACLMHLLGNGLLAVVLRRLVEFMTGIPTVIYGFVGVFVLVPFIRELFTHGSGMCILSAALLLSILIAPTLILFFTDSFAQVPASYLDAVDALGGSPVQKLLHVVIPSSLRGITSGVVLGLGRAMGDTLIALMVAGNAVAVPESVLDSARTLTSHIALVIAADFDSIEFRALFACGIVLYVFTTLGVIAVRRIGAVAEKRFL
jgi:phosphate transport system permease protein